MASKKRNKPVFPPNLYIEMEEENGSTYPVPYFSLNEAASGNTDEAVTIGVYKFIETTKVKAKASFEIIM
jgi:hypothetical protein